MMLNTWCDAVFTAGGYTAPGAFARPGWPSACGRFVIIDADQIDPPARWAGRYLAARWAGDTDVTADLLASATRDQIGWGAAALLDLAIRWVDMRTGTV